MSDMDLFTEQLLLCVCVCVCVCVCCRRCILRGSSLLPSSLMWPAWESWSLRSSQVTEHLSSGLKVKVCLFCLVICVYKHAWNIMSLTVCNMSCAYVLYMYKYACILIHMYLRMHILPNMFIHTRVCVSIQLRGTTGWLYCRTAPGGANRAAPWALAPLWPRTTRAIWSSEGYAPNFILLSPQIKSSSTKT